MQSDIFRQIGMTDGETKVYLALLKLGETTVGAIGKESKVSKSKLYDILDKLIAKGFAGYIVRDGIKRFAANDPRMILEYLMKKAETLEQTKREVEKILPQLEQQRSMAGPKKIAEIYEGFHGLRAIREDLISKMTKGEEFLVLGAPRIVNEKWERWLLDFHHRRVARGVSMRIIYNENTREYSRVRERMKLTQVRYMPSNLASINWIDIFSDAILIGIVLKEPIAFVVWDKSLAESFRAYFDLMWKISKK